MYFIGKICDPLLLLNIEFSLVYSVSFYFISKLSTGELMKNQSLFSCVDYFSIVESLNDVSVSKLFQLIIVDSSLFLL